MELIKPTSDRKVRFRIGQQNTFGLLPGPPEDGGTCPGCTQAEGGCWYIGKGRKTRTCYVDGLMRAYKGIRAILEHNTRILGAASPAEKLTILNAEFDRFEKAELKWATRNKQDPFTHYRLHWSGDIVDQEYAEALVKAIQRHPDIDFWLYTRTFDVAGFFWHERNVSLYLSLDPVNIEKGLSAYLNQPSNNICYMSKTNNFLAGAKVADIYTDMGVDPKEALKLKMTPCPVDTGKMQLEEGCANCRRCVDGKGAVWFKT